MTSLPPRRLVASGRFPLGRIWREVPSVTDRSAILGPGGGVRLTSLQGFLQPSSGLTLGGGGLKLYRNMPRCTPGGRASLNPAPAASLPLLAEGSC